MKFNRLYNVEETIQTLEKCHWTQLEIQIIKIAYSVCVCVYACMHIFLIIQGYRMNFHAFVVNHILLNSSKKKTVTIYQKYT